MEKPIKCFLVEHTGKERVFLKRRKSVWTSKYFTDSVPKCTEDEEGHHEVWVPVQDQDATGIFLIDEDDPRWLAKCKCGYEFPLKNTTSWKDKEIICSDLFRVKDTGEIFTMQQLPAGAMYNADWLPLKGTDGHSVVIKLPDGIFWLVDGKAGNCTKKDDDEHKCWCRHGEIPNITVNKIGNTCGAGAGSIMTADWHGWLKDGWLTGDFTNKSWWKRWKNPFDTVYGK